MVRFRRPSPALVVAGLALTVALGGAALGAIPDNGVIHGCYDTATGRHALSVRDTNETCPAGSAELDWNVSGPQGPQGNAGPKGDPGPAGPNGPKGDAGQGVVALTVAPPSQGRPSKAALDVAKEVLLYADTTAGDKDPRIAVLHCPKSHPIALQADWSLFDDHEAYLPDHGPGFWGDEKWFTEMLSIRLAPTASSPTQGWKVAVDRVSGYAPKLWGLHVGLYCGLKSQAKSYGLVLH